MVKTGTNGVGLLFDWNGTNLGVKRENEANYSYQNLKGQDGYTPVKGVDYFTTQDKAEIQTPIGDAYDPTKTYAIGDYCIYNNTLYRCTGTTTGTWDSSKWTATKITDNLNIVGVSKTEPAEKVWFKKGNNYFNAELMKGLWTDTNNKIANNNSGFYTVVKIEGGEPYTISKKKSTGSIYCATTSVYPQNNVAQVDTWQGNDGITTLTIETSITAKYLFIGLFGGNPTAEQKNECIEELMINQGSTALPYEPYVNKEIQIKNSNNVFEEFYNENEKNDTGWIDMTPYLNTTYFAPRNNYEPQARRIGNTVYWRGEVYCTTNTGERMMWIFKNIPDLFIPQTQFSAGGVHFSLGIPYSMWIEAPSGTGQIIVSEASEIQSTVDSFGFQLTNLNGYVVD